MKKPLLVVLGAAVLIGIIIVVVLTLRPAPAPAPDPVQVPEAPPVAAEVDEVGVDETLFAQGQTLFAAHCAVCHQAGGEGLPPTFPALRGDENLADLALIVSSIHEGRGAMPAFPQFGAEEIAGLATYIRNAWGNEFGGLSVEEVAALLGAE
jgi:mono/diheme cytochrome c family protein